MQHTFVSRWTLVVFSIGIIGLGSPAPSGAQTLTGQARAVLATVMTAVGSTTTTLADTGTLDGPTDARNASQGAGAISDLLTGKALHAATIGWSDQVAAEAAISNLVLSVAGNVIGADLVMAHAHAILGATGAGAVDIDSLTINGIPINVSGDPNQQVLIPGGRVVINEQWTSEGRTVVNGLHIVVDGVADVIVSSATSAIQ